MSQPRLTPEQQRRVERGTPMVDRLARQMRRQLQTLSEDELRSAGYEALVKCGLRYDPEQGAPFSGYSYYRVRGAMLDAARRAVPGSRQRSRAMRVLHATQSLLERAQSAEHGDGPDPRTLEQRVQAAAAIIAQTTAAVLLARTGGADPDRVATRDTDLPEDRLDDARTREHVRAALARCTEDEQRIIRALYEEGLTMTELGERMGKNKSTISRRHAAILRRLGDELRVVLPPR